MTHATAILGRPARYWLALLVVAAGLSWLLTIAAIPPVEHLLACLIYGFVAGWAMPRS